jgi:hypothetical protein
MWFGRAFAVAGLAWCIGVGIWIWMTPIRYEGTRSTASWSSGGAPQETTPRFARNTSFSEISGLGPLPLLIPVLIAATGLWGAWRRRRLPLGIATALMLFFVVLTGFSVGSAYLPAVGALGWALVAELDAG